MAIIKHGNNALANITAFPSAVPTGKPVLLSTATASSSSSIEFTSGIDSTYDIYQFEFVNIHPATNETDFQFNLSIDGGSNYNVTKTTTFFRAFHEEAGSDSSGLDYQTGEDLAQSTSYQSLADRVSADSDGSCSGTTCDPSTEHQIVMEIRLDNWPGEVSWSRTLQLFNPSSTTFVKHFIGNFNRMFSNQSITAEDFMAGYGNTTSAVNAINFKFASGNIDAGTIKMYGISA